MFCYSSIILSDAHDKLLNQALNFAVLPLKLDITKLLVDFNRYSRAATWTEYWYGKYDEEYDKPDLKH